MGNVAEEAGKAISSIAESMKGSPTCIATTVLAGLFATLTYFSLVAERHEMHERQMALITKCIPSYDKK